ncbi:site-specific DNA-methyltransferase [Propionibacteriaceae bacterium Y2011]
MSRLSDLLRQAKQENPELGAEIEKEVRHLQNRRAFGLNFERHRPEAVDLYGRPVRRGDKVRMLPPRGETKSPDTRLWVVTGAKEVDGSRVAELKDRRSDETSKYPIDDLVVVAEENDVIYPGLVSTGKVEQGGDKPYHTVINAENLHALKALLYTHRGRIDCIYIDPPYNTGAKDWKYNNDYVEPEDQYRHSKWLAFMERRLLLAKELLNPADSVLIVTIDEKEYLRLGLLLEQVFPDARIQMSSVVINSQGTPRNTSFSRVDEYVFTVQLGDSRIDWSSDDMLAAYDSRKEAHSPQVWYPLIRSGTDPFRENAPNQFYPIFVDPLNLRIESTGAPLPLHVSRDTVAPPEPRLETVWPILGSGRESRWQLSRDSFESYLRNGYVRAGRIGRGGVRAITYLRRGTIARIERGEIGIEGFDQRGAVELSLGDLGMKLRAPKTIWNRTAHEAGEYGSKLLRRMMPDRKFPFPKSLYVVEDSLRYFVKTKSQAIVLDFFAGSGTTAHAVARLNHQDGGLRQCISITNNEVSENEQVDLRNRGLRPGDLGWNDRGICDHVTKPRIEAAITGRTPDGDPIKGDYKFTDEFPMADGFEENAEFFTLTYEAPLVVASHHAFGRIAPLLWMRAGSQGLRIESLDAGWDVADVYGVIEALDHLGDFVDAIAAKPDVRIAYVITDDERQFTAACAALPEHVEPVRLYESYLRNFRIDAARSAR